MRKVAPLFFYVIALAFAADLLGTVAGPLGLFLALAFAGLGMLAGEALAPRRLRPLLLLIGAPALVLGFVLLGLWPWDRVNRLLSLAVILGASAVAFRAFGRLRRDLHAASAIALAAAVFFLVLSYSPPAWMLWQRASLAVSHAVGLLAGRPLALAPSYSGFDVAALLVISVLVLFAPTRSAGRRRLAFALGYLVLTALIYQMVMTLLPSYTESAHMGEVAEIFGERGARWILPLLARHVPWNMPAALLLIQLPALWIVVGGASLRAKKEGTLPSTTGQSPVPTGTWLRKASRLFWAAATVAALLAGAAVLLWRATESPVTASPDTKRPAPCRVLLYEKGFINWTKPSFDQFGEYSSGMLGRLPVFLNLLGLDAEVTKDLSDNALGSAQVVVVFTPTERFSETTRARLWDFVRDGGSLLVVGEHTWLSDNGVDTLNDLLAPCDIRVNFDSAYYHVGGWLYGYGYAPDPVYYHVRDDMNGGGIGVGASLDVRRSAEPLLWGAVGYSDAGNCTFREQLGYMGDSRYEPGEQLGDVVLAAEQNYGRGRVVVVGDTTGFFNLLMMGSHETLSRLFGKLASTPVERHHNIRLAAALVFLLGACVLAALRRRRSVLPVIVAGLIVGFAVQYGQARAVRAIELVPRGNVALVDASHAQRFSRDLWRDDAIAGLYLNLMRNEVQPLEMESLPEEYLSGARMLFIISPARTYSRREADQIQRFVQDGGYVVVSVGADTADAVEPILSRFGLRVRNRPLGPFQTNLANDTTQVRFRVAYAVEDTKGNPSGILACYNNPQTAIVMIERLQPQASRPGGPRGGLLLIGDGQFFYNKNLEPEKGTPVMENVEFIKWLVRRVGQLEGAGQKR